MNIKESKRKTQYSEKLRILSKNLIEKVADFIPYNYVLRTKELINFKKDDEKESTSMNRRIHQVRKGELGDYEIAIALYKIGKEEKIKMEELLSLSVSE